MWLFGNWLGQKKSAYTFSHAPLETENLLSFEVALLCKERLPLYQTSIQGLPLASL